MIFLAQKVSNMVEPPQREADIRIPAVASDGSLYPIGKLDAHVEAVAHLAISVFLFDASGRMLIQQRADDKYHCPGRWANACCTHPHWDETFQSAATRRLGEELGVIVPLQQVCRLEYRAEVGKGLVEHEHVSMFAARLGHDRPAMSPNPNEVQAIRWERPKRLLARIAETPDDFAPWFRIYMDRYADFGFEAALGL